MSKSSYTDTFNMPTSPNNVQAFNGLVLVGNNFQMPYQKVPATIKYDGFDIVNEGMMIIKSVKIS